METDQHHEQIPGTRKLWKEEYLLQDTGELKRSHRTLCGILLSVILTALIAFVTGLIAGEIDEAILSLLGGLVVGLFFVSPIFVPLVFFRKLIPATCWSFGCAGLIGISATIWSGGWWNPFEAFVYSYIGLLVGVCIALFRVRKYRVYRYATCRDCGYTLVGLPKDLPCPECGRDNSDVVAKFKDV